MESAQTWSIGRVLEWTAKHFAAKGIESSRLDAEVLLSHVLGVDRVRLYTGYDQPLSQQERDAYREVVRRRSRREPVAYIVGYREFFSRRFEVSRYVLIPRPETEQLIEIALEWVERVGVATPRFLDVGTGSGALAVTLAAVCPAAQVVATDVCEHALRVARGNAARLGVADRVQFAQGDCYEALAMLPQATRGFDVIVSNPPYIAEAECSRLQPDVVEFEPHRALFAGEQGTAMIARLVAGVRGRLNRPGLFLCEIGAEQQAAAIGLLREFGPWKDQRVLRDLAGLPRVLLAESR